MEFYHLTLHPASCIVDAVNGDFTGENKEEIVVSTGRILKLLRFSSKTLRIETLFIVDTYSTIHSLVKFKFEKELKDWILISTDYGRMIILKCNLEKKTFDKVSETAFCISRCPRWVPGVHLSVDSKGRTVVIGAMEKVKGVWGLPNSSNHFLSNASTKGVLVSDIVHVDDDTENPLFACLETTYPKFDPHQPLHYIPKQRLVFYEIDMKAKKVQCKESVELIHRGNSLISVPGEKGVLVCSEDIITFVRTDCSAIRCPIPRCLTDTSVGNILVCSVLFEVKKDTISYLVQTEQGHIFKLRLEKEESRVADITIEHFYTIPASSAMCVLDSGFLFAASEFGNHHIYKIQDTFEMVIPRFNSALSDRLCFFLPYPTDRLVTVAELQSLCPVRYMDFASLWDSQTVELCVACGRGPVSAIRVLDQELDIHRRILFSSEIKKEVGTPTPTPTAMWAMKRNWSETFVLVSFERRTAVFLVGRDAIQKFDNSFFETKSMTLGCTKTGDHHFLQICPQGIYVFRDNGDVLINIKWIQARTMEANQREIRISIESCAMNKNSIIVALEIGIFRDNVTRELVHYKISNLLQENVPNEKKPIPQRRLMDKRKLMKVTCMLLSDEEIEDQLLAVGVQFSSPDSTSRDSGCIEVYNVQQDFMVFKFLSLDSICPESLLFSTADSGVPLLMIGSQDGHLVTSVLEPADETRKVQKLQDCWEPVRLLKARVLEKDAVLAVSSSSWLKYSSDSDFKELDFPLPPLVCSLPQSQLFAGFSTESLNGLIFNFQEAITIPLEYTPRMFACDPGSKNFICIETDYDSYTEQTKKKMAEIMKKEISEAAGNDESRSSRLSEVMEFRRYRAPIEPGRWASLIRIFNVETEETAYRLILQQDVAAFSMCVMRLKVIGTLLLVGIARKAVLLSGKCSGASVRTYRIVKKGRELKLLHETPMKDVPIHIRLFQGDVLIATGPVLGLYALGKDSLNLICEKKCVANRILFVHSRENMIVVGDCLEGVSYLLYSVKSGEVSKQEKLFLFAKDVGPGDLAGACLLDDNLMVRSYKSGDLFIVRCPEVEDETDEEKDETDEEKVEEPPSCSNEAPAFHFTEEKVIARYHIGEIAMSLLAIAIYPDKPETIVYGTLMGTIGILSQFSKKEQFEVMASLETRLRVQCPRPFNKNHLRFRSLNYPTPTDIRHRSVIDGDLCEQFLSLDEEEQSKFINHSTDREQLLALFADLRENHSFDLKV